MYCWSNRDILTAGRKPRRRSWPDLCSRMIEPIEKAGMSYRAMRN